MTVRMFNLRMLKPDDFEPDEEGGVRLRPDALRVFFREFEKTMLGLKVRQSIRQQAEALRRVFLGEQDSIEFFRWRAR